MRDYYEGAMEENIAKLKYEIETADAIVIGSGAGLSTSAGLTYSGERFEKYFFDFATESAISTPVVFIRSLMRKHAGHGGQGISISTVLSIRQSLSIRIFLHL